MQWIFCFIFYKESRQKICQINQLMWMGPTLLKIPVLFYVLGFDNITVMIFFPCSSLWSRWRMVCSQTLMFCSERDLLMVYPRWPDIHKIHIKNNHWLIKTRRLPLLWLLLIKTPIQSGNVSNHNLYCCCCIGQRSLIFPLCMWKKWMGFKWGYIWKNTGFLNFHVHCHDIIYLLIFHHFPQLLYMLPG